MIFLASVCFLSIEIQHYSYQINVLSAVSWSYSELYPCHIPYQQRAKLAWKGGNWVSESDHLGSNVGLTPLFRYINSLGQVNFILCALVSL